MNWLRYWLYWGLDYGYAAWRQLAAALPGDPDRYLQVEEPARGPILVIPGVYEPWRFLEPLIRAIHERGHPVYVLGGLGYNRGDIEDAAIQAMENLRDSDLRDVTIVAHSKGGLIGKFMLSYLDPERRIRRLIAIASPFSGSKYARFVPLRAVSSLAPDDRVIRRMLAETGNNGRIVSIYGEFDPHIPGGSPIGGGENVRLPIVGHFRILEEPSVIRAVLERLE